MTIAYPRVMPDVGGSSLSFEPARVDYMSPETGGRIGAVAAGFPLWRMRLPLTNLSERDADMWRAFVDSLRGSRRLFLARDLSRERPRLHRDRPFTEVAADWAQTINGEGDALLALEGLLPGMILSVGDYVGFRWDADGAAAGSYGRRALVRVVERGIANAGGDVTVTVEPPVPTIVPADAEAHFRNASCLMRLVSGSTQMGEKMPGGYTAAGGVIEAVQDLLP